MCFAWHWQTNFHSLNFEISSCINLTPQLRRTPALFFVCFSFFPFCTFFRRCQTNPPLRYSMLSVNNNHHLPRIITRNKRQHYSKRVQHLSRYMTEHDPRSTNGVITFLLLWLFPEKDSSWLYQSISRHSLAKIIDCLMGQAVLEGPGCRLQSCWPIYSDPSKSLSEGTLRVYSVNSPALFVFLLSPLLIQQKRKKIKRGLS